MFDTNIPKVKLSKNIYGTYPKTSPSRKVQNINIVLPVRPKVEPLTNQINVNKKNDYSNNSGTPRERRQRKNDAIQISDMVTTPIRTPDVKSSFKIPATSTPKFSRAYLFSNIGEDNPKTKKICSQNILEKSYIFENKSMNESDDYKLDNTFKCRKLSKNVLEKASIFDSSLRIENFDQDYKEDIKSYKETPIKTPKENSLLQRNIRSIDSILSKDDYDLTMPKSSSMVRDIAKKLEIASISPSTDESLRTKMNSIFQRKKWNRPNSIIHFIRNKYEHEKKNTIKEMGNLTEKENKSSLSRQNYNTRVNQNVVKQLVNVIEKEIVPKVKTYHQSLKRNFVCEEDSFSESEAKSVVTSTSPKDTDSSSDTDQKSLYVNYEQDSFDNENSTTEKTLETEEKVFQDENDDDDDDVYWIPVSNPYKFPRTSSLLTISSQISIDTPSPCISPIRMEEDVDVVQKHWRNTTRKVNPFYRIDETIVIDSGYSDKSEAIMNNSESSITDSYY